MYVRALAVYRWCHADAGVVAFVENVADIKL